jgi:glutamate-1-semialdehyde aminotransferase
MTATLVQDLSEFFKRVGAPLTVSSCSSWFKVNYPEELPFGSLLYHWLREKGVHLYDGRAAFLTVAHTEADVVFIKKVFEESVIEMQAAGLLPNRVLKNCA